MAGTGDAASGLVVDRLGALGGEARRREVAARIPGKGKLKAIEDAPGSYVKVQIDAKKHKPG